MTLEEIDKIIEEASVDLECDGVLQERLIQSAMALRALIKHGQSEDAKAPASPTDEEWIGFLNIKDLHENN